MRYYLFSANTPEEINADNFMGVADNQTALEEVIKTYAQNLKRPENKDDLAEVLKTKNTYFAYAKGGNMIDFNHLDTHFVSLRELGLE